MERAACYAKVTVVKAENMLSETGLGVRVMLDGSLIEVGSAYLGNGATALPDPLRARLEEMEEDPITDQIDELTRLLIEFYERFSSWEQGVVKGIGITLPQMHTLEILGSSGNLRMKELAEKMGGGHHRLPDRPRRPAGPRPVGGETAERV